VTLILSLLTPWYVLQVGDRLVTRPQRRGPASEWDPLANKQLVVRTTDGLIVLGYSGPAYLPDKPTDHAIAEILADARLDWADGRLGMRVNSPPTTVTTKDALHVLSEQLELRLRDQRNGFWLDAIGVWAGAHGDRPVVTSLEYDPRLRVIHREDSWELMQTPFAMWAVPPGHAGAESEAARIHDGLHASAQLGSVPADEAERLLVEAIRRCSQLSNGRIGRHCMSILIQPEGAVRLRYLPDGGAPKVRLSTARGEMLVDGTFSPWVITPAVIVPPRVMVGSGPESIGGLPIVIDGPAPPAGTGIVYAWSAQQRRLRP
jgi:hypothetical protein